jgi:putative membrane protein
MVAWVLWFVAMPLLRPVWGERAVRWGTSVGVTLQAATVLTILGESWGWRRAVLLGLLIACLSWGIEFVGSRTGIPFGRYHYTDRLQPQVGRVPLVIPLAWLMMLPPAWAVGHGIASGRGWGFVLTSALAFTVWDLYLDPQMVGWRLWVWERPGGYFGIPWVNYGGWFLTSAAMTALIPAAITALLPAAGQPARELPVSALQWVYAITWLLEVVGLGVVWGQPGPAICGFVSMGAMLAWAWLAG